jgi:uncharacterized UBP type Zn finger protein
MENHICQHLRTLTVTPADKDYCQECVQTGSTWVHLRVCQTCGAVLCCDSSPNQHASKHAARTQHPVIISAEPNEFWAYCYLHDQAIDIDPY